MESLPFPDPIQDNILLRLPFRSLLACFCVCKKLNSLCDKDFKDRYLQLSLTRARLDPTPNSLFLSVAQQLRFPRKQQWTCSAPVRGWVCLQSPTKFALCNPITNDAVRLPDFEGRKVLSLLSRKTEVDSSDKCLFGYDEAARVFKVLCYAKASSRYQHLVHTVDLRGGVKRHASGSWRSITCDLPHIIDTSSMCKEGFLYYGARSLPYETPMIMRFNVSSEVFEAFPLPEGAVISREATMVNYNGKVALVNHSAKELVDNGWFQLYVRNQDSGTWESERVVVPGWGGVIAAMGMWFGFVGTIGTGELVFTAPPSLLSGSEFVIFYNPASPQGRNPFSMAMIDAANGGSYHYVRACLNHFAGLLRTN